MQVQQYNFNDMITAIQGGNVNRVKTILESGYNVDDMSASKITLLTYALGYGSLPVKTDYRYTTALQSTKKIVKLLQDAGASDPENAHCKSFVRELNNHSWGLYENALTITNSMTTLLKEINDAQKAIKHVKKTGPFFVFALKELKIFPTEIVSKIAINPHQSAHKYFD